MKKRITRSACLVAGIIAGFAAMAASDQAVVRKPGPVPLEVGQALVAHQGEHCIAILPTHVAEEAEAPSLRYVGTAKARLGDLVQTTPLGDDLSIGTIVGGITRDCGHSLASFSRAVDAKLSASTLGALRYVNGDGSLGFEPVTWLDDDRQMFIRVQPTTTNGFLRKGMSGSLLMSRDNTPLGILLSVNTQWGVGKVMRIDRILERAESALLGQSTARQSQNRPGRVSPANRADLTLVAWSAEAASPENRPGNLLRTNDKAGPWISAQVETPVALDFRVEDGLALNSITLDASGIISNQRPRAAEVFLASDSGFRRARSVWGGSLEYSQNNLAELTFARSKPHYIRIMLYPNGSQISLRRISVEP